jgi:hypothetical protein
VILRPNGSNLNAASKVENLFLKITPPEQMKTKPTPEKSYPLRGSDFDDFLKAQGIYEAVMVSPKVENAIRDLGDSIQAGEREAFAAGWNAFVARHSSFLISHSIADTRTGLEQAWEKYWKGRKENNASRRTKAKA